MDGHSTKLLVWSMSNPSSTASRGMYGCITPATLFPFRVLFWWVSDSLEERKSSVELRFLSDSKADGQKKQKKRSWKGKKENAGHLVIWLWRDRTDKNSQLSLTLSSFLLLCIHPFLSPQTLPPFFSLSYLSTSGQNFSFIVWSVCVCVCNYFYTNRQRSRPHSFLSAVQGGPTSVCVCACICFQWESTQLSIGDPVLVAMATVFPSSS